MKYYRIVNSLDLKEIGRFPQSETAEHPVHVKDPDHLWNIDPREKTVRAVICPEPILVKKAKRTDLIVAVTISGRLLISEPLQRIIKEYIKDGFQFFRTNVIDGGKKYPYWLVQAYQFKLEYVDFRNSEVWIEGTGCVKIKQVNLHSMEEFLKLKADTRLPERLRIVKVALVPEISEDFFALEPVNAGIGFYASEKLKNEIENAGLTGISFADPGQYP